MKIQYIDEYDENIHSIEGDVVPRVGEMVMFKDEDYRVKSVTWMIEHNEIVVVLTQNLIKSSQEDSTEGRLQEVKHVMLNLGKRLEAQEKKGKTLTEQLVSVRTYLRTQRTQK